MDPADFHEPIFQWETMHEVRPLTLHYEEAVYGKVFEVELTSGPKIRVFRADHAGRYRVVVTRNNPSERPIASWTVTVG